MKTPEYFNYKKLLNPRAGYVPKLNMSSINSSISVYSKDRPGFMAPNTSFDNSKIDFLINVISADLNDIPPLIDEEFIDHLGNYQAKLIMELDFVKWPNEPVSSYSTTWEKVTETIYKDIDFGNQLNKKGYYDEDVDLLLKGLSDSNQKLEAILNYVKTKVKWNNYYGYTTDKGVSKAYKEGTGNVADINLMLTSMLRYAGFKSNPVVLSTKANGIPLLPTRSGFNYVISAVENPEGLILLDASQKHTTQNILPLNSLNWMGRLIREDGTSDWINLVPSNVSKENISMNIQIEGDLTANGKVRFYYDDYEAMRFREKYENYTMEEFVKNAEKNNQNLLVSNLKVDNVAIPGQAITQSYDFSLTNAVEEIGGKLYVSPLFFLLEDKNPFKESDRKYPVDFIYPWANKYIINIKIPQGYKLESLPASTKLLFKENEGNFTFLSSENGDYLQFIISVEINKSIILASDYQLFKDFFQNMLEKESEKVVLKKA